MRFADVRYSQLSELARVLAGMPPLENGDPWAGVRTSAVWQDYAREMDEMFAQFKARFASPFSAWARAHTKASRLRARTVFYPFSGPDFLFPHLLCPTADNYLLCGLESCGIHPNLNSLPAEDLSTVAGNMVQGLKHFLHFSYFITKDMKEVFDAAPLPGIVVPLLIFLARSGHRIESVEAVDLEGKPPSGSHTPSAGVPGVCIRFWNRRKVKCLYYFTQDLRDQFCKADGLFLQFAARLGRPMVFVKSASYLLHEPYFSNIREFIFNECSSVVQDPSSVPFRTFQERGWNVRVHGSYHRTLGVFERYEQPDLKRESGGSQSLPFGIGYLTDPRNTALILARPGSGLPALKAS